MSEFRRRALKEGAQGGGAQGGRLIQTDLKNAVKAELTTPINKGIPVVTLKKAHLYPSENGLKSNEMVTFKIQLKTEKKQTIALSMAKIL